MADDKDKCVGTEKFMSIAANSGKEQGRKDDLECFGYVLVELGTRTFHRRLYSLKLAKMVSSLPVLASLAPI